MKKWLALCIGIASMWITIPVMAAGYGITIDGQFNDWLDKPKSSFSVATNKEDATGQIAVLRDDTYLYLYASLSPNRQGNKYRLNAENWMISSGNSTVYLTVTFNKTPSQGQMGQVISVRSYTNGQDKDNLFYQQVIPGASGFSATDQTKGVFFDQAEIRIPIASLIKQPHLVKTLVVSNLDMGSPGVTVSGGNTGPWVIAVSSLVVVGGLVAVRNRKGQRV